jgi:hypothetical protein
MRSVCNCIPKRRGYCICKSFQGWLVRRESALWLPPGKPNVARSSDAPSPPESGYHSRIVYALYLNGSTMISGSFIWPPRSVALR